MFLPFLIHPLEYYLAVQFPFPNLEEMQVISTSIIFLFLPVYFVSGERRRN